MQSPHDVWTEYEIEKPLANAKGGEGGIFTLKHHAGETRVAKLYNSESKALLNPEAFHSLALLTSKYADFSKQMPFVAWPIEVLFTVKHPSSIQHLPTLAGITMRHITNHGVLEQLTTNGNGRFAIGTEKAVRIAAVIAHYLSRLHKHGIVFCDLNPKNILVSKDHSNVTFVDADALQHSLIPNVFTKAHYFPGYAAPDHINAKPGPRKPEDDNFVLAIHIFQLLLDGGHPFDTGPAYNPTGNPFATITPHDNIKARRWPYSDIAKYHPPGETPKHYARLHPELRAMFERAFLKFTPPTAAEWDAILPKYRNSVEAYPTPPPRPPAQISPTPHAASAQPIKHHLPTKPRTVPSSYSATRVTLSAPHVNTIPGITAKSFIMDAARWLTMSFWRLVRAMLFRIAKAVGEGFRKHGGFEITAGLIFLIAAFSFFRAYERHLATRPQASQPATAALPAAPHIIDRPVKTTNEASRPLALPPHEIPPAKAEQKPEILPWLTKTTPMPPAQPEAPRWVQKPRLSVDELNALARRIARRRSKPSRKDDAGWTQRGRNSEYRLVPGGTPIFRIRPTN